jgi:hypothetical protein
MHRLPLTLCAEYGEEENQGPSGGVFVVNKHRLWSMFVELVGEERKTLGWQTDWIGKSF